MTATSWTERRTTIRDLRLHPQVVVLGWDSTEQSGRAGLAICPGGTALQAGEDGLENGRTEMAGHMDDRWTGLYMKTTAYPMCTVNEGRVSTGPHGRSPLIRWTTLIRGILVYRHRHRRRHHHRALLPDPLIETGIVIVIGIVIVDNRDTVVQVAEGLIGILTYRPMEVMMIEGVVELGRGTAEQAGRKRTGVIGWTAETGRNAGNVENAVLADHLHTEMTVETVIQSTASTVDRTVGETRLEDCTIKFSALEFDVGNRFGMLISWFWNWRSF
jgi:hypothetical protein